ncbi:MAG: LysR family transcriptional regulator [Rhodobacteraceae bacterium]|nr:LysR family transcriptional regulator [Paracoccaceae bacterium]
MTRTLTDQGRPEDPLIQDLDRLKLLAAFDAILVEGSLTRAAEKLGKTLPAMSRILQKLREHYDEELFERTGKGMVPTAFAESLRPRIRALVAEANSLLRPGKDDVPVNAGLMPRPPMALNQWRRPEDGSGAMEMAHRIAEMGKNPEATQRFASYIATIGNATGQTRPLNAAEAEDALAIILSGRASDIQIGAFLIALQSRGLTEQELIGFTRAARSHSALGAPGTGNVDLDWPAYLSPRAQGAPLFIHAARLVARAGYRVLIHGPRDEVVHRAFEHAGLTVQKAAQAQETRVNGGTLAYLPIENFAPELQKIHWLYPQFMMPNAARYVSALLNPGAAPVSLTGVRGGDRPKLQLDAATKLGWGRFAVLFGQRDAAQVSLQRSHDLLVSRGGQISRTRLPATKLRMAPRSRDIDGLNRLEIWQAIWDGEVTSAEAVNTVIETAAVALTLLSDQGEPMDVARARATELWDTRRKSL